MILKGLYNEFKFYDCVSYFPEYSWPEENPDGDVVNHVEYPGLKLSYAKAEVILIQKSALPKEIVLIGSFPEHGELKIRWAGDNGHSMKVTIGALCLPNSWPTNLGEKVFSLFQGHLEKHLNDKAIGFTQRVVAGKENQLRLIIAKIIHIYNGGRIDSGFYDEWSKRSKRR